IFLLSQLGLLSIATILAVINNKLHQSRGILSLEDWLYAISGHAGLGALAPVPRGARNNRNVEGLEMDAKYNEYFREYYKESCLSVPGRKKAMPQKMHSRDSYKMADKDFVPGVFSWQCEASEDSSSFTSNDGIHKYKASNVIKNKRSENAVIGNHVQSNLNANKVGVDTDNWPWQQKETQMNERDSAIANAIIVALGENGYNTSSFDPRILTNAMSMKRKLEKNESPPLVAARLAASAVTAALAGTKISTKKKRESKPKRRWLSYDEEFPYRRLASRLDCFEMVGYLMLSCLNALLTLFLLPKFLQATPGHILGSGS
ncbi:hypothetical protein Ciccas_008714, partial [Cichlidogyrus casuarinus]